MMSSWLNYKCYTAICIYDEADRMFVGKVCGIRDFLYFHAASVEELEEMFHQSIDNYLSMCEAIER